MLTGYFLTEPTGREPTGAAGCLDDGGSEDAFAAELVLLRVYEQKVCPDPDYYAEQGVDFARARWRDGQRVALQALNEPNNPFEGTGLDPARYRDWFARFLAEVRAREPGLECWWAPMSPGLDPMPWFEGCEAADGVVLHAYGLSVDELMAHVRAFKSAHPTARWLLGETNYGPGEGRTCDRDAWAHEVLAPCLDECSALGAEAVLYFVYSGWEQDDASVGQDTPLDAAGTAIDTVLRTWVPVAGGDDDGEWYPAAVPRPISRNYTPGRGNETPYALVDHIADGNGSPWGWFESPESRASAHFWVSKTGVVEQYRPLADTCWANGIICDPDLGNPTVTRIVASGVDANQVTVAIEHEGHPGDVFPAAQTAASSDLHAWLGERYAIPLEPWAVIGHCQLDSCSRAHCPGPTFPWSGVLEMPPSPEVIALQDALFSLADQIQRLQPRWQAEGQQQMALYCAEQGEAIKRMVAVSKGER